MRSATSSDWSELLCCVQKQDWPQRCILEPTAQSAACFKRPAQPATEPWAKWATMSVLWHSLVVDSTFEQSENVAIAEVSSCWSALRGVIYKVVGSKFLPLHAHCSSDWHTAREIAYWDTLSYDYNIKHTCTCFHWEYYITWFSLVVINIILIPMMIQLCIRVRIT